MMNKGLVSVEENCDAVRLIPIFSGSAEAAKAKFHEHLLVGRNQLAILDARCFRGLLIHCKRNAVEFLLNLSSYHIQQGLGSSAFSARPRLLK